MTAYCWWCHEAFRDGEDRKVIRVLGEQREFHAVCLEEYEHDDKRPAIVTPRDDLL
jgi:hypothetical protein